MNTHFSLYLHVKCKSNSRTICSKFTTKKLLTIRQHLHPTAKIELPKIVYLTKFVKKIKPTAQEITSTNPLHKKDRRKTLSWNSQRILRYRWLSSWNYSLVSMESVIDLRKVNIDGPVIVSNRYKSTDRDYIW